jgi:hypothetical protein
MRSLRRSAPTLGAYLEDIGDHVKGSINALIARGLAGNEWSTYDQENIPTAHVDGYVA